MESILVIGSGGREHAIAENIGLSNLVKKIYVAPGNFGTQMLAKAENVSCITKKDILEFCQKMKIDLIVICPEAPLADGLSDVLRAEGFKVFGPNQNGAKLESDKSWAKEFMVAECIPTADYKTFSDIDEAIEFVDQCIWTRIVIKASGLAGGKGVFVSTSKENAKQILETKIKNGSESIRAASETVILEEFLDGYELSVHIATDGENFALLPKSQDHKRRFEGDLGSNTGGMGAIAPIVLNKPETRFSTKKEPDCVHLIDDICSKTLSGLRKRQITYMGVIYIGLMITPTGPKVLEYNCRFGDPETQVIVPLIDNFHETLKMCANGNLSPNSVQINKKTFACAVCVVIADYPDSCSAGYGNRITGWREIEEHGDVKIYFAGAKASNDDIRDPLTNGGRVLTVCAFERSLEQAIYTATKAAENIAFETLHSAAFRKDIGFQTIIRERVNKQKELNYASAGVSLHRARKVVSDITNILGGSTNNESAIGHFGAFFKLNKDQLDSPVIVSSTDGVGTKLLIAEEFGCHNTIGQDLVGMCVNDILVCGATPMFFLDYFATGKLKTNIAGIVVSGIAKACKKAGCELVGGETAEMPGMYDRGKYDLAGFTVGLVEEKDILPKKDLISEGDLMVGIASSGLHSNGFSLVRKVIQMLRLSLHDTSPYDPNRLLGDSLLEPTLLYTDLLDTIKSKPVVAAAHITGGGLYENIQRVIPSKLAPKIDQSWMIPDVFLWLMGNGISWNEMLSTFNLGVGIVLVLHREGNISDSDLLSQVNEFIPPVYGQAFSLGTIVKSDNGFICSSNVKTEANKQIALLKCRIPKCFPPKPKEKRVAVLISGEGTNLQALINHTESGKSYAKIYLVISNKFGVQGLQRAASSKIDYRVIDNKLYKCREEFDAAINKVLEEYEIELVCLAGFMRILSPVFINRWRHKCINIHPSLLPAFKGKDAQKQALEAGVKIAGCSVHFVTEGVDCGSIIAQEPVPVFPEDTVDTLSARIQTAEHKIYPLALESVVRDEI